MDGAGAGGGAEGDGDEGDEAEDDGVEGEAGVGGATAKPLTPEQLDEQADYAYKHTVVTGTGG